MALLLALGMLALPPAQPILHSPDEIFALIRQSDRPTVVHFWATWCAGCVHELPEVRRLENGLAALGASTLLLSLDDPGKLLEVQAFLEAQRLVAAPSIRSALLDAPDASQVTARFDPRWSAQLPATFVVLQSGAVRASHLGTTPTDVILREVRDQLAATGHQDPEPPRRKK